mmetsp:Transcript_31946/g.81066  ORF Transcript_31946/g.81066 Transcript_31946/m.81066 type:complete len:218 (-) Transcript_31946:2-655(-)
MQCEVPVVGKTELEAIAMVHRSGRRHGGEGLHDLLGVQDESGHRRAGRHREVVPSALFDNDAAARLQNVGLRRLRVGQSPVLLVEFLPVVCRLSQNKETGVLAHQDEALSHLHVPLQPHHGVVVAPVDLRGAHASLVLPSGLLVVRALEDRLVERDAETWVRDGVVNEEADCLRVLARCDEQFQRDDRALLEGPLDAAHSAGHGARAGACSRVCERI